MVFSVKVVSVALLLCIVLQTSVYSQVDTCEKPCQNSNQCFAEPTCLDNQVLQQNASVCGCCPRCVVPVESDASCTPGEEPCVNGYECINTNKTAIDYKCTAISGSCWLDEGTITWSPACEEDGTYSPVQCKGNDRCFCTAPDGTRIFGFEWIENSANMTCGCSLYLWNLLQQGRKDVSIHCTQGGDFEELQCDNYLCWCADPKTGKPTSRVVPETMMTLLSCYNATTVGSQYLRQCESFAVAKARIEEAFQRHGTTTPNLDYINCDYDGSYGPKQSDGTAVYCAWKDNTRIGSWATQVSDIDSVDCNCARDTKYVEVDGKGRTVGQCSANGNYNPSQGTGTTKYCVDSDGYTTKYGLTGTEECPTN